MINLVMASAFASMLIYAMDLLPNRIGLIGGLFYGLNFGLGGIAAAILGVMAESHGVETVFRYCSFLPLAGLLAWFLPRIVGRHKAFELLLLADRFDAAEAQRLGVVNKVVPLAELDAAVAALVGRIVNGPRETYAEMKRLLNQSADQSLDAQLQLEADAFARCTTQPNFDEGLNAFLGKRKARFNG